MDKRSILFVFCVSLAFFGIQSWFQPDQTEHKPSEIALSQPKLASPEKPELTLCDLYKDEGTQEKIGSSIFFEDHFFSLMETPPQEAYVQKGHEVVKVTLKSNAVSEKGPAIYSARDSSIFLPPLSDHQLKEIDLIVFNDPVQRIPLSSGRNTTDAIALLKDNHSLIPVGVYKASDKKVTPFKDFKALELVVKQPSPVTLTPQSGNETFYVLENDLQQLVFSTKGGSLTEINLPFESPDHPESIVKEIDIDREILKDSPQNAHFPLHPYYRANTSNEQSQGTLGGYYPLLRRSILGKNGDVLSQIPSEYQAFNLISEDDDLAHLNYRVSRFEKDLIEFTLSANGRKITKTYSFPKDKNGPYCLELRVKVEGDTQGLWITTGVLDVELVGGSYSPLLRYQTSASSGPDVETISLPKSEPKVDLGVHPNWVSNNNGFLGIILDPLNAKANGYKAMRIDGASIPTRLSLIDSAYNLYPPANYPGYVVEIPITNQETVFRIFAGPFDDALLKKLDALYENPLKNYNPEYISAQSIQGWFSFISQPFAKFLYLLLQLFYAVTRSWAFSIILLTLALRAMMYPLNSWSIRSSIKMQAIGPKVKAVQDRYKNDPKKAQMEVMKLYKESGVNPFMGCLPMLLQMPFLIGMFYLLKSSFPLRGAMFIPGWIDDLAAPDVLFSWGQPIWFFGNEFHLLPILMGLTMYVQQKLSSTLPKNSDALSDTQKQQKMMGNMMSILFMVMFYNFPSGLNIYFMFSTLFGVGQQWWMTKKMKEAPTIHKK